jgi:colanic acid/amylovoran biosynthesis protein
MKFLVVNSFRRDDKGDAALLHVLIDQLRAIDSTADIAYSGMEDPREYPDFHGARNVGSFELSSSSHSVRPPFHLFAKIYLLLAMSLIGISRGRFTWLLSRKLRTLVAECKTADLVVSVGGGYFITNRGAGSYAHVLFVLQTLVLCKQLGRRVATAPVSVGPFGSPIEGRYTAWMLKKLDLVLLREAISSKFFLDNKGALPANVRLATDSAFAFAPEGSYALRAAAGAGPGERVLVLSVRHWHGNIQGVYEQAHADLIDHIAARYPNIRPVFVSQCTFSLAVEDDDRAVAQRVLSRSKTKRANIIEEDMGYDIVKLAYKEADFVVGTRFHSMVFGLSYGVPGIAIEYEHKTRGIMRDLGLEEWVIHIDNIASKDLISLFDRLIAEEKKYRAHLAQVMPKCIGAANNAIGLYQGIIKQ